GAPAPRGRHRRGADANRPVHRSQYARHPVAHEELNVSFILDALRKSEHERRQEEVPSIAHVPLAPPRAHLPPWAVAVMLLLLISVLALTWAWWTHVAPGARLAE